MDHLDHLDQMDHQLDIVKLTANGVDSTKVDNTGDQQHLVDLVDLSAGPKLSNGHSFAENLMAAAAGADSGRLDTSSDPGGDEDDDLQLPNQHHQDDNDSDVSGPIGAGLSVGGEEDVKKQSGINNYSSPASTSTGRSSASPSISPDREGQESPSADLLYNQSDNRPINTVSLQRPLKSLRHFYFPFSINFTIHLSYYAFPLFLSFCLCFHSRSSLPDSFFPFISFHVVYLPIFYIFTFPLIN